MRIAVLANLKKNAPTWEGMSPDQWDDLDSVKTIDAMLAVLLGAGHEAQFFEANILPPHNLVEHLQAFRPDLCFNIAESHFGDARESQIPAVLEMLRLPYTGSRLLALGIALDKPMTKRLLKYHGLPTPEFQVFDTPDDPIDPDLLDESGELRFPLFVKPSREGTSMGVSAESIVRTVAELRAQVARMIELYDQPMLCEHFIQGRELMCGLIGNVDGAGGERLSFDPLPESLTFLPTLEVDLAAYDESEAGLYTNRMKTVLAEEYYYFCPAPIDEALDLELKRLTAATFHAVDCKDVSRVDFRLDAANGDKPYILEINPLPGLNPGISDLSLQAMAAGWSHERLILSIVDSAAQRYGLSAATALQRQAGD
ncbi:MAG: hypothetical protein H7175_22840 [Burkholderiales bacterium]|nr:hypothetical protein [Anaerolineae bacterium]